MYPNICNSPEDQDHGSEVFFQKKKKKKYCSIIMHSVVVCFQLLTCLMATLVLLTSVLLLLCTLASTMMGSPGTKPFLLILKVAEISPDFQQQQLISLLSSPCIGV